MKKNDFIELFNALGIDQNILEQIAYDKRLIVRKRCFVAMDFLYSLCVESISGTASYNDISSQIGTECGVSLSRQAIKKKVSKECVVFFKVILELIILQKLKNNDSYNTESYLSFGRVLIQDSTIIRLPAKLYKIFSGVSNGHSKVCNARIQGTFDIKNEEFIAFSIDPYTKNDLIAAPELRLFNNDLTIRDRGYLAIPEIARHISSNAHCIYRHQFNLIYLDEIKETPLNLLQILKKKGSIDMKVKLNNEERTVVRIVAQRIDKKIANERRRKAKKDNKRTPSREYLEMLSWSIYITTLTQEEASYDLLYKLYSLRWRIEIIFKTWKSNMSFGKVHNVSRLQLSIILMARFIMIIICTQYLFPKSRQIIKQHTGKYLSLIKTIRYLMNHTNIIIELTHELNENKIGHVISLLSRYCVYEKRKKRLNYEQSIEQIFGLS